LSRPKDLPAVEQRAALPKGFRAGATKAGIKASGNMDLAVIVLDPRQDAPVAATFTTNRLPAAPVLLSQRHLRNDGAGYHGGVRALISTSGSANAATGDPGMADQERLAVALGAAAGCRPEQTLAASTGLIGTRLPVDRIVPALDALVMDGLTAGDAGFAAVAQAMCTTDSRPKWATVTVDLPGLEDDHVTVTVSGVAKGVGMIHPRMATMLSFVLTDAAVWPQTLSAILRPVVARTWNQLTVDGDTSTNDTVFLVASGEAKAQFVEDGTPEFEALSRAVEAVARSLARQQAADGEGATTLITCLAGGARDDADARAVARAVVSSSLLKAAVHGRDPNWGRIAGAAGNAHLAGAPTLEAVGLPAAEAARRGGTPVELDVAALRIAICGTPVFAGVPLPFDRAAVREAMGAAEVLIEVDLGLGEGSGEAFGCDLTEAYVIENSEYST
jgi:glutamate N-acetyltransferase/amino-acid N-acetyltransferase